MNKVCVVCGKLLTGRQRMLCADRECHRERAKVLYQSNQEKRKEYQRGWRQNNPGYNREYHQNNQERENARYYIKKERAYEKLARIWNLKKHVCHTEGCYVDDIDLLEFGHTLGNGKEHRKEIGGGIGILHWILKATDEEIKKWSVKPECCMCNNFHRRKGRYPTFEEREKWSRGDKDE